VVEPQIIEVVTAELNAVGIRAMSGAYIARCIRIPMTSPGSSGRGLIVIHLLVTDFALGRGAGAPGRGGWGWPAPISERWVGLYGPSGTVLKSVVRQSELRILRPRQVDHVGDRLAEKFDPEH
jgi:hypothetical protein